MQPCCTPPAGGEEEKGRTAFQTVAPRHAFRLQPANGCCTGCSLMRIVAEQPGVVLAVFFVLFNQLTLKLLDFTLSRVVHIAYYRRVLAGDPVLVKSCDLAPFTSYLLDSSLQPINLYATAVKFCVIVSIVFLTQRVSGTIDLPVRHEFAQGLFKFEPEKRLASPSRELQAFEWSRVSSCRTRNRDTITYYQLTFNLSSLASGEDNLNFDVNDSTVHCLSPRNVAKDTVRTLAKVTGCGSGNSYCNDRTESKKNVSLSHQLSRSFSLQLPAADRAIMNSTLMDLTTYSVELEPDGAWESYSDANLTCYKWHVKHDALASSSACLLIARNGTNTLVERWNINSNTSDQTEAFNGTRTLTRQFPGAVFHGEIKFHDDVEGNLLFRSLRDMNWEALSSAVVGTSLTYSRERVSFHVLQEDVGTVVPLLSIIGGGVLLGSTLFSALCVACVMLGDRRPRFNSIDGLSSILREQKVPTNKSDVKGQTAILGFRRVSPGRLHFGAVSHVAEVVSPKTVQP